VSCIGNRKNVFSGSWDSVVCIVSSLRFGGPKDRVSFPSRGKRYISYQKHPDRLWDPSSIMFKG